MQGIPAMAFSIGRKGDLTVAEELIPTLVRNLLDRPIESNEIWNVNLPPCAQDEVRGVLHDRIPAKETPYNDKQYIATVVDETSYTLEHRLSWTTTQEEGTDLAAVRENYISVGKIRNTILRPCAMGQNVV